MAPEIFPRKELKFRTRASKLGLRAQVIKPVSNSDFVATQGSTKQDVGFFNFGSVASGAGVTVDAFYVGALVARDFQLGNNLFVKNSKGQDVVIAHLDGPTTVS